MRLPEMLKPLLLLTALVCAAAIFSACSSDDDKSATPTAAASKSPSIDVSAVPELKDGKLTIGSDIAYAPIEYYEEGTTNEKGMDVDIARAMGQLMGVQVQFQQVADFAGIVGDLTSGRYDIVMSAISITSEREAQIDFVAYFGPVGTGILTLKGNPKGFTSVDDLCGHPVAAQDGTFQIDQMTTLNEGACKGNPIDIRAFPDNPTAVQELALGRVDAELADDPVAAYSAAQSTEKLVELAVPGFEAAPYGIGVRKDSPEMKAALEAAFAELVSNGTYADILGTWGQEQFALKS
jgi:polar amino acid transport system substrate-binding protein